MDNLAGLNDLLPFLNLLKKHEITFTLHHDRDDALMVTVSLVRARVEVEFFEDHVDFSRFTGDESVENDVSALLDLIEQDIKANK